MVSRRELTNTVQWSLVYERLLRAGIPRDEIPDLIRKMGMEHVRWINREAMEPQECPNCPNEFHPKVLEDARLDGKETIICQGCRSKLWLVVDEEHYGTVPVIHKPTVKS
ncbi:hypothetical protein [Halomonas lysinitropha]|uniref:Uncharacterized protein n=1 Tax=Halomonas lysinitropha TaxID=2607506 RepID=A0A5K1I9V6_9GAMM|nr:hypothetical protein [Halomonas lysinitropha]VVZ96820.1 hypothetical protein HALO32_02927 [Halomonas lysinitropha]